jgi:hypothetical protein
MKFVSALHTLRVTTLEWMIIEAVPILNRFRQRSGWVHSLDDLRHFPEGSWGAYLARFLDLRGFDDFLPNYETHDAFHTLLGYETDVIGEMRLQAFMLGNRSASFAGRVLFVLGCFLLPELWPQLRLDLARGRQSPQIRQWNIPALLACDLYHLKQLLGRLSQ